MKMCFIILVFVFDKKFFCISQKNSETTGF